MNSRGVNFLTLYYRGDRMRSWKETKRQRTKWEQKLTYDIIQNSTKHMGEGGNATVMILLELTTNNQKKKKKKKKKREQKTTRFIQRIDIYNFVIFLSPPILIFIF